MAYGISFFTPKDNYAVHFGYKAYPQGFFKYLKSTIGCNNFNSVVWTAPSLIFLNIFL